MRRLLKVFYLDLLFFGLLSEFARVKLLYFHRSLQIKWGFRIKNSGTITLGIDVNIDKNVRVTICENSSLTIRDNVSIGPNVRIFVPANSNVYIGCKSRINSSCIINGSVIIKENVVISRDVYILSTSHRLFCKGMTIDDADKLYGLVDKPIVISKNVFVGMRSTIYGGALISEDCLVASGSTVSKFIPPSSLVKNINCILDRYA